MNPCVTCEYWLTRIAEERARAINGIPGAYRREIQARRELKEHQEREKEDAPCR
jgi:hypothetical protein